MEFLNKVELKGNVGSVRFVDVADKQCARFSLATNISYKNEEGLPVIETTWFYCTAWESDKNDIHVIEKGANLHITGRFRAKKFADSEGVERITYDVYVNSLKRL